MFSSPRRFAAAALALGLVSLASAPPAQAGLLVEPYLGYHTGKIKQSGNPDSDVKGMSFGGRLGYQQMGVMAGLDYMTGSWTTESSGYKFDVTPTQLGLFVGYSFPMMLRVYGVYSFQADGKIKNGALNYDQTQKGTGIKLGVGFTVMPLLSLNVEYLSATFTKDKNGNKLNPEVKNDLFGLTVSVPFDL